MIELLELMEEYGGKEYTESDDIIILYGTACYKNKSFTSNILCWFYSETIKQLII